MCGPHFHPKPRRKEKNSSVFDDVRGHVITPEGSRFLDLV
jgi:hypothetical protein